jgi:hypothetical protein
LEEKTFVEAVINDLKFAAQTYNSLSHKPKSFKQLIAYPQVTRKLVSDPVFFAVLMCGDSWLIDAPDHQKLLRDLKLQTSGCLWKRLGQKLSF